MTVLDVYPSHRAECADCFGTGIRHPDGHQTLSCLTCRPVGDTYGLSSRGVWAPMDHRQVLAEYDGWVAWVDEGIRSDVELLWAAGIPTWVSCEGGGLNERYISVPGLAIGHMIHTDWGIVGVDRIRRLIPWANTVDPRSFQHSGGPVTSDVAFTRRL